MEELLPVDNVRNIVGMYLQYDEAKKFQEYMKLQVLTPEYILLDGSECYDIASGNLCWLGGWPNIERIRGITYGVLG